MSKRTKAKTIPEWLMKLPAKSLLNSRDFAEALGISLDAFHTRFVRDDIPACDHLSTSTLNSYNKKSKQWKAITVRNHIRKLIREGR
tara:strand:+ start:175 stop:435 length:261 start_codon:yes stop_codon:yes gene_type:complete